MSVEGSKFLPQSKESVAIVDYARNDPRYSEEHARDTTPALSRHPHFFEDVRLLSRHAGLSEPPALVIKNDVVAQSSINATALKTASRGNIIEINSRTLQKLDREALKAVLGHEIAHLLEIERSSLRSQGLMGKVTTTAGRMAKRAGASLNAAKASWEKSKNPLLKVAGFILKGGAYMTSSMMRDGFSMYAKGIGLLLSPLTKSGIRHAETMADLEGTLITGDPDSLIRAFRIMKQDKLEELIPAARKVGEWRQDHGPSGDHPAYSQRIRDLERLKGSLGGELRESRNRLDELRGTMKRDFTGAFGRAPTAPAVNPAVPAARSQSLRASPGQPQGPRP